MKRLASLGGLLLLLLQGCTISAISEDRGSGPSNSCSSDDDCTTRNCVQNVCQAVAGQLEALLIEVTPPSDSSLAHIPLITRLSPVPVSGGETPLLLPHAAHVTGRMVLPPDSTCTTTFYFADGKAAPASSRGTSIPVTVTLTPRDALLGLPSQTYMVQTDNLTIIPDEGGQFVFDLQVPAGDYDIYVAPPVVQEGCLVPPQLYRRQSIPIDGTSCARCTTDLRFPVVTSKAPLTLRIDFPLSGGSLQGWLVDIIESVSGNPISTQQVLGAPDEKGGYSAVLAYSAVNERQTVPVGAEPTTSDLVRLRPPPELVAPTIFLARSGLGLFSPPDMAALGAFTKYPTAVKVEAQLTRLEDGAPVRGHVTLVSTEIFGVDEGVFASYQRAIDVGNTGIFELDLPPGKYRVYAVPPLSSADQAGLSAHEVSWEVPADVAFQAGKLIELPSLAPVIGQTSIQGAQVQVLASPQSALPFEQAFGAAVFVPRATPGLVDDRGRFRVQADPGRFDVSVRPVDSSGFAWFVRPGVQIQPGGEARDLGRLVLPAPSMLTGEARVSLGGESTAPIPSALIRAYTYLDKNLAYTRDPVEARSVIQVAETRSDSAGRFRLLVPSSIDAPK